MNTTSGFKTVVKYLQNERQSLRSMLIYSVTGNIFLLAIPFVVQQLVQQYSLLIFQQATVFLITLAVIFLLGITAMRALQLHLSEFLQRRLFYNGIQKIKAAHSHKNLKLSKINYVFETITLQKSVVPLITDGFTLLAQGAIVLLLVSIYHPLFIVFSFIIIIALYFVVVQMGYRTERFALEESTKKYDVISKLQNLATSETSPDFDEELDKTLVDYYSVREMRYKAYFNQSLGVLLIKVVASAFLLFIGGLLVVKNQMTIGQLVASELIITNLLISLFKFSHLLDYWFDTVVGVTKLETHFPPPHSTEIEETPV